MKIQYDENQIVFEKGDLPFQYIVEYGPSGVCVYKKITRGMRLLIKTYINVTLTGIEAKDCESCYVNLSDGSRLIVDIFVEKHSQRVNCEISYNVTKSYFTLDNTVI